MTAAAATSERAEPEPRRPGLGARSLQLVGWLLMVAGAVVLLYVVYALFFTNLETDAAQKELRAEWEVAVGPSDAGQPETSLEAPVEAPVEAPAGDAETGHDQTGQTDVPAAGDGPDLGAAVALLEFVRPGTAERPVRDGPLLVVEGVTPEALTRGPGHYPASALPGEEGNFAVAGHRTTYGAPFFRLDDLRPGDEIHVTDRSGQTHVYEFVEQRIVAPNDSWVVGPEPLDRDGPLLTLTTCHPRFSARQRLIVFAELVA